ncbi:MAG: methylornithine synthase PylB [Clostridia bacterium]|nr:methylornithine synthase PylB [Clostridia bacterium]
MFESRLTRQEILDILKMPSGPEAEEVFARARASRAEYTGNRIFAYGFVYFTTWCRNNCNFCYFRRSNHIDRYRKSTEETIDIAMQLAESGVNLIDLTMGEDPQYHEDHFEQLITVVREIKQRTGLPVMLSPGVVSHDLIDKFASEGAEWYALYQETHNREVFSRLRIDQSYDERMDAKCYARDKGMLIEEGLLAGCGESMEDLADSILIMGQIGARQIRVMSFIPQEGSPMENMETPDRQLELNVIAAMRLAYPWALIPASLDVDGIDGLEERINAGSSVVTSIIPPHSGFVGVAHETMDVDSGGRTVQEARAILQNMGLVLAEPEEYRRYIRDWKL